MTLIAKPDRQRKLLVAIRSEIAIRVFRAATKLGLRTVAIYAAEDRLAIHRFKADEAYVVGAGKGPVGAYRRLREVCARERRVVRAAAAGILLRHESRAGNFRRDQIRKNFVHPACQHNIGAVESKDLILKIRTA